MTTTTRSLWNWAAVGIVLAGIFGVGRWSASTPAPPAAPHAPPSPAVDGGGAATPTPAPKKVHHRGHRSHAPLTLAEIAAVNARQPKSHRARLGLAVPAQPSWSFAYETANLDQGSGGTCWDFASVELLRMLWLKAMGVDVGMSEQQVLNCIGNGWNCTFGGDFAGDFLRDTGTVTSASVPYEVCAQSCNGQPGPYKLTSWGYVSTSATATTAEIKTALVAYGPIAVAVYASNSWDEYQGGTAVLSGTGPDNHLVVIVAWDDTKGKSGAWKVHNSWGTDWGNNGDCWVEYGIGDEAAYGVVESPTPPPPAPTPVPPPAPAPTPIPPAPSPTPPGPVPVVQPIVQAITPVYGGGYGFIQSPANYPSPIMWMFPANEPTAVTTQSAADFNRGVLARSFPGAAKAICSMSGGCPTHPSDLPGSMVNPVPCGSP